MDPAEFDETLLRRISASGAILRRSDSRNSFNSTGGLAGSSYSEFNFSGNVPDFQVQRSYQIKRKRSLDNSMRIASRRLDVIVQYEVYEVISDDQTGINTKKAYGTYINITGETIDVNQNSEGYHKDKEGVHGAALDGIRKRIEAALKIYQNMNPQRSFIAVHGNSNIYFLDHSGNEKKQCKVDRTFLQCLQTAYQLNEKQDTVDNILSVKTGTEQNNVYNVPIMRIKVDKQKSHPAHALL